MGQAVVGEIYYVLLPSGSRDEFRGQEAVRTRRRKQIEHKSDVDLIGKGGGAYNVMGGLILQS